MLRSIAFFCCLFLSADSADQIASGGARDGGFSPLYSRFHLVSRPPVDSAESRARSSEVVIERSSDRSLSATLYFHIGDEKDSPCRDCSHDPPPRSLVTRQRSRARARELENQILTIEKQIQAMDLGHSSGDSSPARASSPGESCGPVSSKDMPSSPTCASPAPSSSPSRFSGGVPSQTFIRPKSVVRRVVQERYVPRLAASPPPLVYRSSASSSFLRRAASPSGGTRAAYSPPPRVAGGPPRKTYMRTGGEGGQWFLVTPVAPPLTVTRRVSRS